MLTRTVPAQAWDVPVPSEPAALTRAHRGKTPQQGNALGPLQNRLLELSVPMTGP
jgi:hypothetical protein